ncbi:MAG TPA: glutamine synthetase [Hellea balneolensis]|uniref:Glutamine synthetase n=1 Tax=Hellea balneolensis TaxID=287478 RepID=A0A7C3GC07_9PROT|nr:glutamine synthetase [Hellea balneolensis]
MSKFTMAEYIWLDGAVPTRFMRSKARTINVGSKPSIEDFPEWSFDGSSTNQADGHDSDCILKPVTFVTDPIRGEGNFLVFAEVFTPEDQPHESNSRAQLRAVLDAGAAQQDPWAGFEQEYTLFANRNPLGWPEHGFPAPQGPYYCGVGADEVYGREIVEHHARVCLEADLMYYGLNAEVMPGQWEFQIGFRGDPKESCDVLTIADHTWLARWLLYRVAEEYGVSVSTHNKPVRGDWNGAGMHTNFSTKDTRDPKKGREAINKAVEALAAKHQEHIVLYGHGLGRRLTGLHETCDINTFRAGAADRGASIRIPKPVDQKGYGYFEDRRPGANADPYLVAARLCTTVCGIDESVMRFSSWPREDKNLSVVTG